MTQFGATRDLQLRNTEFCLRVAVKVTVKFTSHPSGEGAWSMTQDVTSLTTRCSVRRATSGQVAEVKVIGGRVTSLPEYVTPRLRLV